jgi:2-keto-4-pentenoate hydratase/2-oxohepta-3-ene-1,7-dioic acid hydratase in catechol pathway
MCAGQNYQDHLDEKAPVDIQDPEFFIKAGQTIAGLDEPCLLDARVTRKLDYETELGVVIGKAGRHVAAQDALDHVFGYLVVNDVTARDRQVIDEGDGRYSMALGPGKNFDGSSRLAGTVVTADEIPDPHALALTTHVDGELRQSNSTASMVFSVPEIIAYLSTLITLLPGTVIATGTPGGTGWGTDPELGGTAVTPPGCVPARYLAPGDRVRSAIEGVGALEFEVVEAIGPSAASSGVLAA